MSYAEVFVFTVGAAVLGSAVGISLGIGIEWLLDEYWNWRSK